MIKMTLKEYALKEDIPFWKMQKLIILFDAGISIRNIAVQLDFSYYKTCKYLTWRTHKKIDEHRVKSINIERRYYQTEDEMIIPDYKAEDLTGVEKLIFDRL